MGKGGIGDYLASLFKEGRLATPVYFERRSPGESRRWWVYGDLAAIGAMMNPNWGFYTTVVAPKLTEDLTCEHCLDHRLPYG